MTSPIVFEDLPQSSRRPSAVTRHTETASQLKANPLRWARIQEGTTRSAAASVAYQIRKGILAAFRPAGTFEAKSLTVDEKILVYARYVGASDPGDSA